MSGVSSQVRKIQTSYCETILSQIVANCCTNVCMTFTVELSFQICKYLPAALAMTCLLTVLDFVENFQVHYFLTLVKGMSPFIN